MQLSKIIIALIASFSSLVAARGDFSKSCHTLRIKGDRFSYDGFEVEAKCGRTTARLPLNYCLGFDGKKLVYDPDGDRNFSQKCETCFFEANTANVYCLCDEDDNGPVDNVFDGFDLDEIIVNRGGMLYCNGHKGHTHS